MPDPAESRFCESMRMKAGKDIALHRGSSSSSRTDSSSIHRALKNIQLSTTINIPAEAGEDKLAQEDFLTAATALRLGPVSSNIGTHAFAGVGVGGWVEKHTPFLL